MNARWWPAVAVMLIVPGCDLEIQRSRYHARFDDAGGLREGAAVYVAGVRVGRVDSVKLDGEKADMAFSLDRDPALVVRADACVSVRWYAGSEAHVRLQPGTPSASVLPSDGEIACTESANAGLDKAMGQMSTVMADVVAGKGTIGRLLQDEELANKVERFFDTPPPASAPLPVISAPVVSAGVPSPPAPRPAKRADAIQ